MSNRTYDFDIDVVFNTFRLLAADQKDQEFIDTCKARQFKMTAPADLVAYAKSCLATVAEPKIAGPRCPACPAPGEE